MPHPSRLYAFSPPSHVGSALVWEVSTRTTSVKLVLPRQSSSLFVNKSRVSAAARCPVVHSRRVPSAPFLCIAVVVSIIIAEVITSPRTFCAFHPPQKAGVSFAFWFVWRFFFIIFFSSCFRNQLLGSAALSYQLEWKVTKVLVRTNCIECR